MSESARFGKLWADWDKRIKAGELPREILRHAKDEDLVEILAGESQVDRKYARDIIATELLNRLHVRSTSHHGGAQSVADSAQSAHEMAQRSQGAIHHAEAILKGSGQWDLGAAVSASAYASLDATAVAFDAAKRQANALHETLSQSRLASELADEASRTATEGISVTQDLEATMDRMGKGDEGRAASEASQAISTAAGRSADRSADHEHEMQEEAEKRG